MDRVFGSDRLELLHELVPKATAIAVLVNPTNPNAETVSHDLQAAARALGLQIDIVNASTERDIDAALLKTNTQSRRRRSTRDFQNG